jgi:BirA family biotin operon repressor/biotin-[acetyl-CoA-carboxylase] ligase
LPGKTLQQFAKEFDNEMLFNEKEEAIGVIEDSPLDDISFGKNIHFFEEVSSTNDVAKELALEGTPEWTIVVAEKQFNGRGRFGRKWVSPKGGLWFSLVLRPKISINEAFKLTSLTAVSIVNTLEKDYEIKARIKWPNDIFVNGKKVCGVLTETASTDQVLDYVIIGIGINVNNAPSSLPDEIQKNTTSLMTEKGEEINTERFLTKLLQQMEEYYRDPWKLDKVIGEWKRLDSVLGKKVIVSEGNESYTGEAVDVDDLGVLMVKLSDGSVKRVTSASISLG